MFYWVAKKYKKHVFNIKFHKHPKYIQKKLSELDVNQFGYNCFGLKNTIKKDKVEILKRKIMRLGI